LTDQAKMIELVQANGEKAIPLELIRGGERLTVNVTPQRRKQAGLTWRAVPHDSFFVDFVRPGVVLSERVPLHGGGGSGHPGDAPQVLQQLPGTLRHEAMLQGKLFSAPTPRPAQEAPAEVSKRLDQMAEDIKQMREAIEALSKAVKEKN
jgi:hypothetical protein